jgi:DNA-binding GntR family transcriptional regulator
MQIQTVTYHITESLRNQIIQGKLKAGQRIMDTDIISRLDVSRTPIREALKILEAEGLITNKPRKGAFVAEYTLKDVWEVYTINAALYALAVDVAMDRISNGNIKKLKDIFQKMEEAVKEEIPDINKYQQFHFKFHDTLFQISMNARLRQICNGMNNQIKRFSRKSFSDSKHLLSSCQTHKEILQAIEIGDKSSAKELIYTHVMEGLENLQKILKDTGGIQEGERLPTSFLRNW